MGKRSRESGVKDSVSKRQKENEKNEEKEKNEDTAVRCYYCGETMSVNDYYFDKCFAGNCSNFAPACCDTCNDNCEFIHEGPNEKRYCKGHWRTPVRKH